MSAIDAAVIFVLSLLIGTVAILAGVRVVLDRDAGVPNAALTALIGAAVWAVTSYFVGWLPLVGALIMLVAWVGVINWRYPGGWPTAAGIGIVAWVVAVAVVYAASLLGIVAPDALGIPGV
ncbi:hypothetical protein [Natronolimnohabitans innermongolicus]|uniref:Integral membrane protein n=1 Tax=Natronolimnohabitans innermongolicus JCM 12255 TaxID=1227499 RepID=L9X5Y3_9EURY|nr:hypothetical protein [Natronolimnohabitans innermongolicus]ELY56997.1 hypothetical protein C493_09223 [Natronolimnohabitans innermongolicus JCM 12255]